MSNIKHLLKSDFVRYMPGKFGTILLGLILVPVLIRVLGIELYGNYSLAINIVMLLATFGNSWIIPSVNRYEYKFVNEGKSESFFSTMNFLTVAQTLLLAAIFLIIAKFAHVNLLGGQNSFGVLSLIILAFSLQTVFLVLIEYLRPMRHAFLYGNLTVLNAAFQFIFILLFVYIFGKNLTTSISGFILSYVILIPFSLYFLSKKIREFKFNFRSIKLNDSWEWVKYGLPLGAGNLAAWAFNYIDRIFIKVYVNDFSLGVYSGIYDLFSKSIQNVSVYIFFVNIPICINLWEQHKHKETYAVLESSYKFNAIINLFFAGLFIIANSEISVLLNGFSNPETFLVSLVLSVSFAVFGLFQVHNIVTAISKTTSWAMISFIVAGAINTGLNFYLVPAFSILGASIATLVSAIVLFLMIYFKNTKSIKIPVLGYYFKIIVMFAISIALSFGVQYIFEKTIPNMTIVKTALSLAAFAGFVTLGLKLTGELGKVKGYARQMFIN